MDPRHPEQAIARMRELMAQYDRIEKDMNEAYVASRLGQLEREGGLVIQEICLVAPRLHEAMMQASRKRRHDLSRGIVHEYTPEEKVGNYIKATIGIKEEPEEVYVAPNQAETVIVEPKPRKKKTTKKKKVEE